MESSTATVVTYSLKEKFFQVEPEGRIRRYQYLVRILAPGFTFLVLFVALSMLLGPIAMSIGLFAMTNPVLFGIITSILSGGLSWVLYKVSSTLAIKRSRDFGSDGKLAKNIVLTSFVVQLIGIALGLFVLFGILKGGSFDSMAGEYVQSMPQEMFSYIQGIVGVIALVMGIILLFRPGNKGDNAFGKDPINTKVSFLG